MLPDKTSAYWTHKILAYHNLIFGTQLASKDIVRLTIHTDIKRIIIHYICFICLVILSVMMELVIPWAKLMSQTHSPTRKITHLQWKLVQRPSTRLHLKSRNTSTTLQLICFILSPLKQLVLMTYEHAR